MLNFFPICCAHTASERGLLRAVTCPIFRTNLFIFTCWARIGVWASARHITPGGVTLIL